MASIIKYTKQPSYRCILHSLFRHNQSHFSKSAHLCHPKQQIYSLFRQSHIQPISLFPQQYRFMSQTRDNDDNNNDESIDKSQETDSEEDRESTDDEQSEQIEQLDKQINELESELHKYKEALARSHADKINLQNMNKKDVENMRQSANKRFARDMLTVADALQGCIKVINDQIDCSKLDNNVKSVIDGVKLTESTLMNTFKQHGVQKVPSINEEFDPNMHEALFQQEYEGKPANTVIEVIAEGYTLKDTLLRPAKVGVSLNVPKPQEETIVNDDSTEENTIVEDTDTDTEKKE